MAQISYIARNFVQERLLDAGNGFNFWIRECAGDYPNAKSFQLQLAAPTNFFIGDYTPEELEIAGYTPKYPFAILKGKKSTNAPPIVTPSEFSGATITVVDVWAGFPTAKVPADGESIGEMIEDAMTETFSRYDYASFASGYEPGLTFQNQIVCEFGPMQFGGENWRKLIRFTIQMRYLTSGR
jgi:hypothetical protein